MLQEVPGTVGVCWRWRSAAREEKPRKSDGLPKLVQRVTVAMGIGGGRVWSCRCGVRGLGKEEARARSGRPVGQGGDGDLLRWCRNGVDVLKEEKDGLCVCCH